MLAHAQHFHVPSAVGFAHPAIAGIGYPGAIRRVSTDARQPPHQPVEPSMRAGSIREDVARYNEERAAFRPYVRGGGAAARPPIGSPYRN